LRREGDGDGADAEVEGDLLRAAKDGVIEIEPACGAERGMAGELEFFAHGEDADVDAALAFDLGGAGQDEGGLAEIGLAGERCISAVVRPRASVKMASALPARGCSAKTSTMA
jgi:hypothetical protein